MFTPCIIPIVQPNKADCYGMDIGRYLIQNKEYVKDFDVENPSEMVTGKVWKKDIKRV